MSDQNILAPYIPLPWQIKPWGDKNFVLLLTGSAGGGKSKLAGEKVNAFCWHYPGATALILRKAQEWTRKSVVPFMWQSVMGRDKRIKYLKQDGTFEYPNGSMIYSGGLRNEEQVEALRSIGGDGGLDIVWMEEANAFTRQDFEEVVARVRHDAAPWRQIILTTNPDAPMHWINQDFIIGGAASVYFSGARDNPHNPPDYLKNLGRLTGVKKARLVEGKWVQAEGVVYEDFDSSIHVIREKYITSRFRRKIRVVDFGYKNPFVCQFWEIDEENRMVLYKELYGTGRIVEDWARDIIVESGNDYFEATICDHDAEDRATLERHLGTYTLPAEKDIESGIDLVRARLKVQDHDGRPRIQFVQGALVEVDQTLEDAKLPTCTLEEIEGYHYPKGIDGKPIKEVPVKLDDHGMDTMRYAVKYVGNYEPEDSTDLGKVEGYVSRWA